MGKISSLGKAYFLYFLILVGLVVFRILSSLGMLSIFGGTADYIFTFIIQVLILFLLSVSGFSFLTKKDKNTVFREYKFNKISKKLIFLCVLMGFVVYFLNSYIASFFYFILSLFGYSSSNLISTHTVYPIWMLILNLIFTAVLPAVCEETAHRGMLLSQIGKRNTVMAIIISSLLFGLLHINIYQFFYATILGVLLAKLTLQTNSIYPAMIIHFMNNALNVYMSFASVNNLFSAKLVNLFYAMASMNTYFGILFLFLFYVFLLLCLKFLFDSLKRETNRMKLNALREGLGRFITRKIYFDELECVKNNTGQKEITEVDASIISDFISQNSKKIEKENIKNGVFYEKIFLFASFALSFITTIFTFIWGII